MIKTKLFIVLFLLFSLNSVLCQTTLIGRVVGIKDGDTVVVLDSLNR